jgi:DNA-binding transcriptional regulator YiaG
MKTRTNTQKINVRETRRQKAANQTDFWTRLRVTQSGGSRYESGRAMPPAVALLFQMAYTMTDAEAAAALASLRQPLAKGE